MPSIRLFLRFDYASDSIMLVFLSKSLYLAQLHRRCEAAYANRFLSLSLSLFLFLGVYIMYVI